MNKEIKVEAEGGEAIVRSGKNIAVLPANQTKEGLRLLKEGNHAELTKMINNLPTHSKYAEDGTLIPDDGDSTPVKEEEVSEEPTVAPNVMYTEPPVEHKGVPYKLPPQTNTKFKSPAYTKFYAKNSHVKGYKYGSKEGSTCDCSGGVCNYYCYDRKTKMNNNSTNMYNKRKSSVDYDNVVDGTMLYLRNKNKRANHIGVVAVDPTTGKKRFVNVSSDYSNGVGDEDLDKYMSKKKARFDMYFFEQGDMGSKEQNAIDADGPYEPYVPHDKTIEVIKKNNVIKKSNIIKK